MRRKHQALPIDAEEVYTKISAYDVVDESTGEVLLECNEEVTEAKVEELRQARHQGASASSSSTT